MRAIAGLLLLLAGLGGLAAAPAAIHAVAPAQEPPAHADIVIRDFAFQPDVVHVARGGSVTWTHDDGPSHTVTGADRSFAQTLGPGQTFTLDAGTEDAFIDYYCAIHAYMRGRIVVGDGPPPPAVKVLRVPEDEPDLARALLIAAPETVIDVAAGQYLLDEPLAPAADGVTIRGRGAGPNDVRITPGRSGVTPGVLVDGVNDVSLEQLSLVSFAGNAVEVRAADGFSMRDVEVVAVDGGRRDGVRADVGVLLNDANGVGLLRVRIEDALVAGIDVADCDACAVALRDVALAGNSTGVRIGEGASVVASHVTIEGGDGGTIGVHVTAGPRRPARLEFTDSLVAAGRVGMWLASVRDSRIEGVTLTGHAVYGLGVAGGVVEGLTVRGLQLHGNAVDVGWDGAGTSTCFDLEAATTEATTTEATTEAGAPAPAGPVATSDPPTLAATASCDAAAPFSPYWPIVTARLLAG